MDTITISKPTLFVVLSSMLLFSCLKKTSRKETEESLKTTMDIYLNHQPRIDSSQVKFTVLDVVFFEEKTDFVCDFRVNLKQKLPARQLDTIGIMRAKISKDFKDVTRVY
jgi:hypothetical protein